MPLLFAVILIARFCDLEIFPIGVPKQLYIHFMADMGK